MGTILTDVRAGIAALLGGNVVIDAGIGVAVGFAVFAVIGWLYRKMRGRDGLGIGDAKLLASAGAWVGLPSVIGIAAVAGLFATVMLGSLSPTQRIPFGPYLCNTIWLVWLYGPVAIG